MKTTLQNLLHVIAVCVLLACLAGCGGSELIVNAIEKVRSYQFRVLSTSLVNLSPSGAPFPTTDQIEVRALRSYLEIATYSVCPSYDPQWSLEYDHNAIQVTPIGPPGPIQSFQVTLNSTESPKHVPSTVVSRGYAIRYIRITAKAPNNVDYKIPKSADTATTTVYVWYDPSKLPRRDIVDP